MSESHEHPFADAVREHLAPVVEADARYSLDAYRFLLDALDDTIQQIRKIRHVTASELAGGFRRLALKRYGNVARAVLRSWGITRTRDIGEMVWVLLDAGLLSRTEEDRLEDFDDLYDFAEALRR